MIRDKPAVYIPLSKFNDIPRNKMQLYWKVNLRTVPMPHHAPNPNVNCHYLQNTFLQRIFHQSQLVCCIFIRYLITIMKNLKVPKHVLVRLLTLRAELYAVSAVENNGKFDGMVWYENGLLNICLFEIRSKYVFVMPYF